jgi:RNA polymerase primary sigma factor
MSTGNDKLSTPVHSVDKSVYTGEQQIEAAKELERLRTACWVALLSHPSREVLARIEQARSAYFEARNRFAVSNVGLVYKFVGRLQGRDLPLDDLVQEGTLGLLVAADRFDYRRTAKFSTFAFPWIRSYLAKAFIKARMVRSPRGSSRRFAIISLDSPTSADGDQTIGDLLESPEPSPLENVEKKAVVDGIPNLLDSLNPREKQIIELRYVAGMNLYAIGGMINRTSERVRQVENAALEKLAFVAAHGGSKPNHRFRSERFTHEYRLIA